MKRLFLLILLVAVFPLASCNMPVPCAPAEIGIAGNMTPTGYALVGLNPTLQWEYPSTIVAPYPYPAGSSDCAISGYDIFVMRAYGSYYSMRDSVSGAETNTFTTRTLEPNTVYFWEVRAVSSSGPGPWSSRHAFVTGPQCTTPELTAPSAWRPTGTVNTLRPTFNWGVGPTPSTDCVPTGAHFELSTDPGFGSLVASFDGNLSPREQHWIPESDLMDCTDYYWRVAKKNDAELGPYSNRSFRVEVGACPLAIHFIPSDAANCRIGPYPLYDRLTILNRGTAYPIVGQHTTQDGAWYKLNLDNNLFCWASDVAGDVDGDPKLIPVETDFPPLPAQPGPGDGSSGGICPQGQVWSCNLSSYPPACSCK